MGERNPRDVLGLPDGASEEDLRGAYRRLALRYHPDRNRGDETAAAKFREVSEAYAVLRRGRQRPGASGEGMAAGASRGFAFDADVDAELEFAFAGGADTVSGPSRHIHPPGRGTAGGPGAPDYIRGSGGRAARRGVGLPASLCLMALGGVLVGVALPKVGLVFGTRGPAWPPPSASSAPALAPAANAVGSAAAILAAANDPPKRPAVAAAEDAPGVRCAAPAEGPPVGGAPLARAGAPVADVSADHAAAPSDNAAAYRVVARPEEPAGGQQVAARAQDGSAGRDATSADHASGVAAARSGPPPAADGTSTPTTAGDRAPPPEVAAKAAALFAARMRYGEKAMGLSDVVGARSHYERAAALDPASSAAAIAAGETYDPHVLARAGVPHPWLADAAKAAAWYERARALGDPAAVGLLTRLR